MKVNRSSATQVRLRRVRHIQAYHARRAQRQRLDEMERYRSVAEGLRNILEMLNANLPEKEVLSFVCAQATILCGALAAAVYRFDEETRLSALLAGSALPVDLAHI